jgi:hypothetical protein
MVTQVCFKNDEEWQGWRKTFIGEYFLENMKSQTGGSKKMKVPVQCVGGSLLNQTTESQLTGLTALEEKSLKQVKPNVENPYEPYSIEQDFASEEQWKGMNATDLLVQIEDDFEQVRALIMLMVNMYKERLDNKIRETNNS